MLLLTITSFTTKEIYSKIVVTITYFNVKVTHLLASERSERDTLRSVQSRIVYILLCYIMVRAIFVLITRKEGGA